MTYLEISGTGNPNSITSALHRSPLMSNLTWGYGSGPGPDQPLRFEERSPDEINHRQIRLTVDTGQTETKEQIDALLTGAGLADMHSEFVEGDFPAGAFYDASDDDD